MGSTSEKCSKIDVLLPDSTSTVYEESWNSPIWRARVDKILEESAKKREKFGFTVCPQCATIHALKTVMCRGCNYRVQLK